MKLLSKKKGFLVTPLEIHHEHESLKSPAVEKSILTVPWQVPGQCRGDGDLPSWGAQTRAALRSQSPVGVCALLLVSGCPEADALRRAKQLQPLLAFQPKPGPSGGEAFAVALFLPLRRLFLQSCSKWPLITVA